MDIGPCRDEIKRSNIVICFSLGGFSSWGPPKEWISLLKMTDCLLFRKTMGKKQFPGMIITVGLEAADLADLPTYLLMDGALRSCLKWDNIYYPEVRRELRSVRS